MVESCCCQRMPCHASSTDWQCFWYQPVCMRGASCLCVSKLGPSVGTFRSHTQLTTSEVELFRSLTPMSSTFGRVVLLSADAMPCYVALALTGSAFGTSQCSVYAWRKLSVRVQTGTIRRDISLTHPTNHIGGRVVSLTHTNVEYFWSSRAAVSGCHAMLC